MEKDGLNLRKMLVKETAEVLDKGETPTKPLRPVPCLFYRSINTTHAKLFLPLTKVRKKAHLVKAT